MIRWQTSLPSDADTQESAKWSTNSTAMGVSFGNQKEQLGCVTLVGAWKVLFCLSMTTWVFESGRFMNCKMPSNQSYHGWMEMWNAPKLDLRKPSSEHATHCSVQAIARTAPEKFFPCFVVLKDWHTGFCNQLNHKRRCVCFRFCVLSQVLSCLWAARLDRHRSEHDSQNQKALQQQNCSSFHKRIVLAFLRRCLLGLLFQLAGMFKQEAGLLSKGPIRSLGHHLNPTLESRAANSTATCSRFPWLLSCGTKDIGMLYDINFQKPVPERVWKNATLRFRALTCRSAVAKNHWINKSLSVESHGMLPKPNALLSATNCFSLRPGEKKEHCAQHINLRSSYPQKWTDPRPNRNLQTKFALIENHGTSSKILRVCQNLLE